MVRKISHVGLRSKHSQFVEKCKSEISKYMRERRISFGMTSLAQLHGLRGDTSIEERVKYILIYKKSDIWIRY